MADTKEQAAKRLKLYRALFASMKPDDDPSLWRFLVAQIRELEAK